MSFEKDAQKSEILIPGLRSQFFKNACIECNGKVNTAQYSEYPEIINQRKQKEAHMFLSDHSFDPGLLMNTMFQFLPSIFP